MDDQIIIYNISSSMVMSKILSLAQQIWHKSTQDSIHFIQTGKKCEMITLQKRHISLKKSVSILKVIGQNLRASAMLMVTSAIRLNCVLLVRWVVVMFADCGCVGVVLLSASAMLPMLVFVFSHSPTLEELWTIHRYSCFGYFLVY